MGSPAGKLSLFKLILSFLLAGTVLFFPLLCPAVIIEKVMAVVNGEVIVLTEVQEESIPILRRMSSEALSRGGMPPLQTTEREVLEGLIDRRLQLQEAKKQGISVSPAEVEAYLEDLRESSGVKSEDQFKQVLSREGLTLEKLRRDVEGHLVLLRLVNKEVRSKVIVSEQEVRKAYEEQIDRFVEPTQLRLRYLLVAISPEAGEGERQEARARAEAALTRLRQGSDFSQVVKEYSSGPMAEAGGDIGYVKKGELHPEVEKIAFSLQEGCYSEIISLPSGYAIVKVEERRTPIRSYSEVCDEIREKIYQQKVVQQYREWMKGLRAKAFIEIK